MDDKTIIKLFNQGSSVKQIATSFHAMQGNRDRRITLKEAKCIVEKVIYDDYMKNIARRHS